MHPPPDRAKTALLAATFGFNQECALSSIVYSAHCCLSFSQPSTAPLLPWWNTKERSEREAGKGLGSAECQAPQAPAGRSRQMLPRSREVFRPSTRCRHSPRTSCPPRRHPPRRCPPPTPPTTRVQRATWCAATRRAMTAMRAWDHPRVQELYRR